MSNGLTPIPRQLTDPDLISGIDGQPNAIDQYVLSFDQFSDLYNPEFEVQAKLRKLGKTLKQPVEQLSINGISLLMGYYAESEGIEAQPLIASTVDDIKHLGDLMSDPKTPPGTEVTVIYQDLRDTDDETYHKTVFKLIKDSDNNIQIIHNDSAQNTSYSFRFFEDIRNNISDSINIDFYVHKEREIPKEDILQASSIGCGVFSIKIAHDINRMNLSDYIKSDEAEVINFSLSNYIKYYFPNPEFPYDTDSLATSLNKSHMYAYKLDPSLYKLTESSTTQSTKSRKHKDRKDRKGRTLTDVYNLHPEQSYYHWFAKKQRLIVDGLVKSLTPDELFQKTNKYFVDQWSQAEFARVYSKPAQKRIEVPTLKPQNIEFLLQEMLITQQKIQANPEIIENLFVSEHLDFLDTYLNHFLENTNTKKMNLSEKCFEDMSIIISNHMKNITDSIIIEDWESKLKKHRANKNDSDSVFDSDIIHSTAQGFLLITENNSQKKYKKEDSKEEEPPKSNLHSARKQKSIEKLSPTPESLGSSLPLLIPSIKQSFDLSQFSLRLNTINSNIFILNKQYDSLKSLSRLKKICSPYKNIKAQTYDAFKKNFSMLYNLQSQLPENHKEIITSLFDENPRINNIKIYEEMLNEKTKQAKDFDIIKKPLLSIATIIFKMKEKKPELFNDIMNNDIKLLDISVEIPTLEVKHPRNK